jgi:hypothetical protein
MTRSRRSRVPGRTSERTTSSSLPPSSCLARTTIVRASTPPARNRSIVLSLLIQELVRPLEGRVKHGVGATLDEVGEKLPPRKRKFLADLRR